MIIENAQYYTNSLFPDDGNVGIKATINTDDPAVEGIELKHEYDIAAPSAGLSVEQIKQAQINGVDIAFLSDHEKQALRASKVI